MPELLNDLMESCRTTEEGDPSARIEGLMDECKLPARARQVFRRTYVYPEHRYLTEWQVLGAFPNEDDRGLEMPFPPEMDKTKLEAEYRNGTETLKWRLVKSTRDFVELSAGKPPETGVGYAVCWIYNEKARPATLEIGSDDGSKVWINRKLVHSVHEHGAAAPAQWRDPVYLPAGWSEVLVKVEQIGDAWGFYLEFADPDGRGPLDGLKVSTTPGN